MKRALSILLTALSTISLIWMGYAFPNGSLASPALRTFAVSQPASVAPASETVKGVKLVLVVPIEALGLMLIGAQNADRLPALTDVRDLCTIVKGNAVLQNPDLGQRRFTKEFETCADRTLHHEAAFLQAGSILGAANILRMTGADFCGVFRIAMGRALLKYVAEAGRNIPDYDTMLKNINEQLSECARSHGKFALPPELWNDYANLAIILPFYGSRPKPEPAEPSAPSTEKTGTNT